MHQTFKPWLMDLRKSEYAKLVIFCIHVMNISYFIIFISIHMLLQIGSRLTNLSFRFYEFFFMYWRILQACDKMSKHLKNIQDVVEQSVSFYSSYFSSILLFFNYILLGMTSIKRLKKYYLCFSLLGLRCI